MTLHQLLNALLYASCHTLRSIEHLVRKYIYFFIEIDFIHFRTEWLPWRTSLTLWNTSILSVEISSGRVLHNTLQPNTINILTNELEVNTPSMEKREQAIPQDMCRSIWKFQQHHLCFRYTAVFRRWSHQQAFYLGKYQLLLPYKWRMPALIFPHYKTL